jgi:hypothetical protein
LSIATISAATLARWWSLLRGAMSAFAAWTSAVSWGRLLAAASAWVDVTRADIAVASIALAISAVILAVEAREHRDAIACYPVVCEGFAPFSP